MTWKYVLTTVVCEHIKLDECQGNGGIRLKSANNYCGNEELMLPLHRNSEIKVLVKGSL